MSDAVPEHGEIRIRQIGRLRAPMGIAREVVRSIRRTLGEKVVQVTWQPDVRDPEVEVREVGEGGWPREPVGLDELLGERPADPRVLIVCPNDDLRSLLGQHFELLGLRTQLLATGTKAISAVEAREYDLLVLGNLVVPPLTAHQLLSKLRPYLEFTTPVIVCSGRHPADVYDELHELLLDCFVLPKPFRIEAFRRTVYRALEYRALFKLRAAHKVEVEDAESEAEAEAGVASS